MAMRASEALASPAARLWTCAGCGAAAAALQRTLGSYFMSCSLYGVLRGFFLVT